MRRMERKLLQYLNYDVHVNTLEYNKYLSEIQKHYNYDYKVDSPREVKTLGSPRGSARQPVKV